MVLTLVDPSADYRASFLSAEREFATAGGERLFDQHAALIVDFPTYVQRLLSEQGQPSLQPGRVPASVLWLVEGQTYIGRVNLRHRLNPRLRRIGGHIGYEIRPSLRRRGYGRQALALALQRARGLRLRRVLLVCDADNAASQRIIEANGGILEGIFQMSDPAHAIRRYWINL